MDAAIRERAVRDLRNGAAWLKLAGDRLEAHRDDDAARMVAVGVFAVRDVPDVLPVLAPVG